MGVLSGFRFTNNLTRFPDGLTTKKITDLASVGKYVGWNFIIVSCLIVLAYLGYAMLLGYNRNPGGMIAMVLMNFVPLIGLGYGYNFFYGYGTAHILPTMSIFGLHRGALGGQIVFIIIFNVAIALFWLLGWKIRSLYAAKYEIEI
jgi:hypothetical protein